MRFSEVENERVPVGGDEAVGELGDAPAPEVGPGLLGWIGFGEGDFVVVEDPSHAAAGYQPVIQAPGRVDVVVLQVERRQLGVFPGQAVPVDVALEEVE